MLDHILSNLDGKDIGNLRLTASAFRAHPCVLASCSSTELAQGMSSHGLQAAASFLCQLPRLQQLTLKQPGSVYGVQQLTQLCRLEINGYRSILDLSPLGTLPLLTSLRLVDCHTDSVDNLSELSRLVTLRVSPDSLHHQVSLLTALKVLRIDPDSVYRRDPDNFSLYSSLTGLTSLCDDISGDEVWDTMPCLRALQAHGGPHSLHGVAAVTSLRALQLDLSEPDSPLTSLAPLSSLVQLGRLFLYGATLPLPALPALTRLSLEADCPGQDFPGSEGLPSLRELHVEPRQEMHLPDLSVLFPSLSRIVFAVYVDVRGHFMGRLCMSVLEMPKYVVERRERLLGIDEDEY